AFASTLDPRFKALKFLSDREREEIKNSLKDDSSIQSRSVRLPLRISIGGQSNVFDDLFDNLQEPEQ
ncbi:11708_t:CDS:2, partial [Entrophospora sp. SA101]